MPDCSLSSAHSASRRFIKSARFVRRTIRFLPQLAPGKSRRKLWTGESVGGPSLAWTPFSLYQ
jgi:hypothetical protein